MLVGFYWLILAHVVFLWFSINHVWLIMGGREVANWGIHGMVWPKTQIKASKQTRCFYKKLFCHDGSQKMYFFLKKRSDFSLKAQTKGLFHLVFYGAVLDPRNWFREPKFGQRMKTGSIFRAFICLFKSPFWNSWNPNRGTRSKAKGRWDLQKNLHIFHWAPVERKSKKLNK